MNKLPRLNLRSILEARAGLVGGLLIAASVALGGCASQPHGAPARSPAPAMEMAAAAPAMRMVTERTPVAGSKLLALRGERSTDTISTLKRKAPRKMVLPEESGEADLMLPAQKPVKGMGNASADRRDGARG